MPELGGQEHVVTAMAMVTGKETAYSTTSIVHSYGCASGAVSIQPY